MNKPATPEDYWLPTKETDLYGNLNAKVEINGPAAHLTAVEMQDGRVVIIEALPLEWYQNGPNRIGYSVFELPYQIPQPWAQQNLPNLTMILCGGTLEFQSVFMRDSGSAIGPKMEVSRCDGAFLVVAVRNTEHLSSPLLLCEYATKVAYGCSLHSGRKLGRHLISCIQTLTADLETNSLSLVKTEHEYSHNVLRVPGKEQFVFDPAAFADVGSAITNASEELAARVTTSLSWITDGHNESIRNQFLRIWFAIDALAIRGRGNNKNVSAQLAKEFVQIYGSTLADVKDKFYIGRIEGIRDAIVHQGFQPDLDSTFVDYCYCTYCDFLLSRLGLPSQEHARLAMDANGERIVATVKANMLRLRDIRGH